MVPIMLLFYYNKIYNTSLEKFAKGSFTLYSNKLFYRCRINVEFAIKTAWLLDAYAVAYQTHSNSKTSQGLKLRNVIVNNELHPNSPKVNPAITAILASSMNSGSGLMVQSNTDLSPRVNKSFTKAHSRTRSEATGMC